MKIDNGTGGSRGTSTGGPGSRPGRSAVDEGGRESINFFAELKRRNVYKVAVAYAVVGWLLMQVAMEIFLFLQIPFLRRLRDDPRYKNFLAKLALPAT
jgi:hypothetical protein